MAEVQRDLTPEQAAAQLRQCSDDRYVGVLHWSEFFFVYLIFNK